MGTEGEEERDEESTRNWRELPKPSTVPPDAGSVNGEKTPSGGSNTVRGFQGVVSVVKRVNTFSKAYQRMSSSSVAQESSNLTVLPFWLEREKADLIDNVNKRKPKGSKQDKLYQFFHEENLRHQLTQKSWKILNSIQKLKDGTVSDAKKQVEQASKAVKDAEEIVDKTNELIEFAKDQKSDLEAPDEEFSNQSYGENHLEESEKQLDPKEKEKRKETMDKVTNRLESLEVRKEQEEVKVKEAVEKLKKAQKKLDDANQRMEAKQSEFIEHIGEECGEKAQFISNHKQAKYRVQFDVGGAVDWTYAYAYGPVGDLPMHTCFLLGLVDLGKKVIDKYYMYTGQECISLPYIDDTKAWKLISEQVPDKPDKEDLISEDAEEVYSDGGLYTGETVLHIAIVQNRDEKGLIKWLLHRNCNVVARAKGAFFKPSKIITRSSEGVKEAWPFKQLNSIGNWIQARVPGHSGTHLASDGGQRIKHKKKVVINYDSACDYGELPLSFAASVGNLDACTALLHHVMEEYSTQQKHEDEKKRKELVEDVKKMRKELVEEVKKMRKASSVDSWDLTETEQKEMWAAFKKKTRKEEVMIKNYDKKKTEWRKFQKQTKAQLDSQGIHFDGRSSRKKIKDKFTKDWNQMPVGDTQEHELNKELEDMIREVADVDAKKVQFFFMNAAVCNGCYTEKGTNIYYGGNTALHMAVIHRQSEIIDWLMVNGSKESLGYMNDEHLTPFTLAAYHGYVDIFQKLTNHMRETQWVYGQVQMSRLSLEQLDSFRIGDFPLHKQKKWQSAIEVIVNHEVDVFANDPLFNRLIMEKWTKFGRNIYLRRTLVPYVILLSAFCAYMFLRCYQIDQGWQKWIQEGQPFTQDVNDSAIMRIQMRNERPEDRFELASLVLQILLVCPGSIWLIWKGFRQARLRRKDYDPGENGKGDLQSFLFKNLQFVLDSAASILMLISLILRLAARPEAELDVMAVLSVLMWTNLLNLIMPFKFFGIMAITTYKMLVGDVLRFLMVFVITTMAFALAMTVLYQKSEDPDNIHGMDIPGASILNLIWVSLGQVDNLENIARTRNFTLTIVVHVAYCILQTILMLNLLVAMMSRTFNSSMDDTHKTWIFPFAQTVLRYEKALPDRIKNLAKNRCGEADRGDVAAMNADQIKKAKFYIVEVGEDQRKKEDRMLSSEQEAQHAIIIESVKNKLQEWVDEDHEANEKNSRKDQDLLEKKMVELEKLIKNLSSGSNTQFGAPSQKADVTTSEGVAKDPGLNTSLNSHGHGNPPQSQSPIAPAKAQAKTSKMMPPTGTGSG